MIKRALIRFTVQTIWLVAIAMLLGGFPHPAAGKDRATTAGKAAKSQKQSSMSDAPLIPRDVLFGNPHRAQARLSPDGKWISFQAPVDGVLNIWVAPADDLSKAKAVTEEKVRPIPSHNWAYDNKHILYIQDKNGDENFHLYATNVETRRNQRPHADRRRPRRDSGGQRQVSRTRSSSASTTATSATTTSGGSTSQTGEKKLVQQNPGVAGFLTDDDFTRAARDQLHAHRRPGLGKFRKAKATPQSGKTSSNSAPKTR